MRLFLTLLLLYPFMEIATLITLAHHFGGFAIFMTVLASSLLGIWMLRNQKMGSILAVGSIMTQGRNVSLYSLLWPVRYLLAGLFFTIPGILSDLIAVILLLPLKGPDIPLSSGQPFSAPASEQADIIEGEYNRVDTPSRTDKRLH